MNTFSGLYTISVNLLGSEQKVSISFPIGYIFDVLIAKFDLFGASLQPYYKATAPGLWGAIAFEVAILVGFVLHKYLLPRL